MTADNQILLVAFCTDRTAGLQVEQMHLAAFKTAYRRVGIGIIARCFLYEDALNVRSCDGTAKEKRWHGAPPDRQLQRYR